MRSTHPRVKTLQSVPSSLGAGCVFLAIWACYLRTLNPAFLNDDSAETLAVGARLGISHPPGYPLLCLLQRIIQAIPLGAPSWRGSMASAALAALGATLLGMAVLQVWQALHPKNPLTAWGPFFLTLGSASLLAFSRTFWMNALTAKGSVYHLQLLILIGTFGALGRILAHTPVRPRDGALLLFWSGLGLSHHWPTQAVTLAALLPVVGALRLVQNHPLGKTVDWIKAIALGLTAWSPLILYSPLRECFQPASDFGAVTDWSRWKAYAGLSYYSFLPRASSLGSWAQDGAGLRDRAGELLAFLGREPVWGWALLVLAGLALLGRRFPLQVAAAASLGLGLLSADLFVNRLAGNNLWPLRNPLLGLLLVEIPVGIAALSLVPGAKWRRALPLGVLLLGLILGVHGWKASDQSRSLAAWTYGQDLLASCPRGALLFAEEDCDYFGSAYFQEILGRRPDLDVVTTFLWQEPWGVARSASRHPHWGLDPMRDAEPWDRVGENIRRALHANVPRRPVFVSYSHRFVLPHALGAGSPWGLAIEGLAGRILRAGQAPPPVPGLLWSRILVRRESESEVGTQPSLDSLAWARQHSFRGMVHTHGSGAGPIPRGAGQSPP